MFKQAERRAKSESELVLRFALVMMENEPEEKPTCFKVVLLIEDSASIGITVAEGSRDVPSGVSAKVDNDRGFLIVKNVHENGLVSVWNNTHPGYKVESGQLILQVNGEYGSTGKLMEPFQRTEEGVLGYLLVVIQMT